MSIEAKLRLINQCTAQESPRIVLMQKNQGIGSSNVLIAWKVMMNLGIGDYHPFVFPYETELGARESVTTEIGTPIRMRTGHLYEVIQDVFVKKIEDGGLGKIENQVELVNKLETEAIAAEAYRDGKLLAVQPGVAPGESAPFVFDQIIWIGVVPGMSQGGVLNEVAAARVNTRLDLSGISSADIVMSGGGSQPYSFALENIL